MNNNEKHIESILDSLDGLEPAQPSPFLFSKIEKRIIRVAKQAQTVPLGRVSVAAASIVLLLTVNYFLLTQGNKQPSNQESASLRSLTEYYGLADNEAGI